MNEDVGEVGLSGLRAEASKLTGPEFNYVGTPRVPVGKGLKFYLRLGTALAEFCEVFMFWVFFIHRLRILTFLSSGSN